MLKFYTANGKNKISVQKYFSLVVYIKKSVLTIGSHYLVK